MEGRRRGPEKGLPARAVPYIREQVDQTESDIRGLIARGVGIREARDIRSRQLWAGLKSGKGADGYSPVECAVTILLRSPTESAAVLVLLPKKDRGRVERRVAELVERETQAIQTLNGFSGEPWVRVEDVPLRRSMALKAPWGSGKTEIIGRRLREAGVSVLHVSSRVSLASDAAARLALSDYRDLKNGMDCPNDNGIASCLPSIAHPRLQVDYETCDAVIIDEAVSCARLFCGEICRKTAEHIREILRELVRDRPVFLLDADLTDKDVRWWELFLGKKNTPRYVIPEPEKAGSFEFIPQSTAHARILRAPHPIWISTDSRKEAIALAARLEEETDKKVLLVTGGMSDEPLVKRFMADPNRVGTEYDVVVVTPAIDTGLSVTSGHFREVFGLFFGETDHLSFAQSLRRNRTVNRLQIAWCGQAGSHRVYGEVLRRGWELLLPDVEIRDVSKLIAQGKELASMRRASKWRGLVWRLLAAGFRSRGESPPLVGKDEAVYRARWRDAWKDPLAWQRLEEIANAPVIDEEEYYEMRGVGTLDAEAKRIAFAVRRALHIEEITPEQVGWWQEHRDAVQLFMLWRNSMGPYTEEGEPGTRRLLAEKARLFRTITDMLHINRGALRGEWTLQEARDARAWAAEHALEFEAVGVSMALRRTKDGTITMKELPTSTWLARLFEQFGIQFERGNGDKKATRRLVRDSPPTKWCLQATINRAELKFEKLDPFPWEGSDWAYAKHLIEDGVLPLDTEKLGSLLRCSATAAQKHRQRAIASAPPNVVREYRLALGTRVLFQLRWT